MASVVTVPIKTAVMATSATAVITSRDVSERGRLMEPASARSRRPASCGSSASRPASIFLRR